MFFVTPAYAQDAPAAPATPAAPTAPAVPTTTGTTTPADAAPVGGGPTDLLIQFGPIVLLVVIFWLLIFRPQQKRQREHQQMLSAVKRGDTVVTTGGLVGKVTKAVDGEDLEVEIAQGTRIKLVRSGVADVRSKATPVNDNGKAA